MVEVLVTRTREAVFVMAGNKMVRVLVVVEAAGVRVKVLVMVEEGCVTVT